MTGDYSTKCMHNSRIKNGMTIELRGKRHIWGQGDEILPDKCYSELGLLYIHSQEAFLTYSAALAAQNAAFSLVLTPKITTTDESLRTFDPLEYVAMS